MKEYKHGSALVRIHGNPDRDKLKEATGDFLKKVERCRNEKKKEKHLA